MLRLGECDLERLSETGDIFHQKNVENSKKWTVVTDGP